MAEPTPERMPDQFRRRMLMFYFAAGINIVMAMWVVSMGSAQVSGGVLAGIVLVFLAFAYMNFRFAKRMQRQWDAHLRQRMSGDGQGANPS